MCSRVYALGVCVGFCMCWGIYVYMLRFTRVCVGVCRRAVMCVLRVAGVS